MQILLLILCFVIQASAPVQAALSLQCSGDTSCEKRCDDNGWDLKTKPKPHCHCDRLCDFYQDCCPDYRDFCAKVHHGENQPANQLQPPNQRRVECVKTSPLNSYPGTYMITSCAADWNDTEDSNEQEKCLRAAKANRTLTSSNIIEDVPVLQLGAAGNTYRNEHCAFCNRVPHFILFFWRLQIECEIRPSDDLSDQQKLDFMLKYCPERSIEPGEHFFFRFCYPYLNITSECSISGNAGFRNSCLHDPTAIVHDKNTNRNYKNYGCFLCNNLTPEHVKCGPSPSLNFFEPKSFEVVMNFKREDRSVTATTKEKCKKGQVYDSLLEVCREGLVASPFTAMRDKYRVNAWLTAVSGDKALTQTQFRDALCEHFKLDKQQVDEITITKEDRWTSFLFNLYGSRTKRQLYNKSVSDGISELLEFNSSFQLSAANSTWTVFRVTSRRLACAKGDLFGPNEFNISLADMRVFIYNTSESLPANGYHLIIKNESAPPSQGTVFVCRSSFTVWCPKVLLPIENEEYTILPNKSLLRHKTGELFPIGEYDIEKTEAWICTDYLALRDSLSNSTTSVVSESVVLRYLTIVGLSLSVLCLFLVLLTHCILPELRKPLPGKNLMSLCASLLLAHFLWLFGSGDTDKETFCTAIAIALHYFFLVSFACTVILAFDTWRTFSSKMSTAKGASSRAGCGARFLVYTGLAWGIPLVWVAACAGLDYFDIVAVGYGGPSVCWITNTDALLIGFAAPVACALLFNMVAFSQTVWAISRAKQRAHQLNTSRHDNAGALKIYARLITLMGFSWVFSFSAELIHRSLLYPFVIFSTSQGVYIFIAFVCKARVLKMFKNKLRPSAESARKATQNTNSSFATNKLEDETTM